MQQLEQKASTIFTGGGRTDISGARLIMPADNKQSYVDNGYNINDIIYSVINLILDKVRLPYWELFKVVDQKALTQYNMMMKTKDISTRDYKKALHLKQQALDPLINTNLQDRKSTRLNSSHSRASRMPSSA